MPTRHARIQVIADAELDAALQAAQPHLPRGLSRAGQVRELALAGARHLTGEQLSEAERRARLERLAGRFENPDDDSIDWNLLTDIKRHAWRQPG